MFDFIKKAPNLLWLQAEALETTTSQTKPEPPSASNIVSSQPQTTPRSASFVPRELSSGRKCCLRMRSAAAAGALGRLAADDVVADEQGLRGIPISQAFADEAPAARFA
ncbi:unnamed protein product [Microthlaspi erraticum]|uniref:Uncharacterized protein n=1 Tax=Microthlaspi erraticum TaxID=1685480 RepID=A0A6D2HEG8_9BRAS|nr:unnamed protein product [Microthlaspi erraticum]